MEKEILNTGEELKQLLMNTLFRGNTPEGLKDTIAIYGLTIIDLHFNETIDRPIVEANDLFFCLYDFLKAVKFGFPVQTATENIPSKSNTH